MNQKLIPIIQRIIAHDSVLSSFDADNLPQSAQPYLWKSYARGDTPLLSDDEQRELQSYLVWCGNPILKKTFSSDSSSDASRYYLFEDDSLLIVTNAYQQVWADARDFAIECILPLMRLDLMDAQLLRAIEMEDAVESIRDEFFHAFAETLHRECRLPHCDARGHWDAWSRQAPDSLTEELELGGRDSGSREGQLFAETFTPETATA